MDNAATSWPKPNCVYTAVDQYQRENGASAGRAAYFDAVEASRLVDRTRSDIAALVHVGQSHRIIFTQNGTDSLNLAIHGLLRPGDHVVASVAEHNSVLRPLTKLRSAIDVELSLVPCDSVGLVDPQGFRDALQPNTRLFCLTHASNVVGTIQPIEAVGRIARENGVRFLVDAAQTLGHVPIDLSAMEVDLLAAPGHKGLLGPLGTGILYVGPDMESQLTSCRQGGTGTQSEQDHQPTELPEKYESGNLNVPGIVGVGAAVRYLATRGVESISKHEQQLTSELLNGLATIGGVDIVGPADPECQVGVVSIKLHDLNPHDVATALDSEGQIQVRAGLHCAPRIHQTLGTVQGGGTVRFSLGLFNSSNQVEKVVRMIDMLASSLC